VMPKMSGLDAYRQIQEAGLGDVPTIFVTGYSPQIAGALSEEVTFLHKPFGLGDLRRKVREALDLACEREA